MKNKDVRQAFTSIELNDEQKEQMLEKIYQRKKQKKRTQMIALAAGILVLITSLLLLQNFLDGGGQDPLHGEDEYENDEEIVEDDPDEDDEIVEEPKDDEEEQEEDFERYIAFEIPPHPGGMGDELYMVDDLSELELKLRDSPWHSGIDVNKLQELGVASMPVFMNPFPSGMSTPEQAEKSNTFIVKFAEKLGLEIVDEDERRLEITLENGITLQMNLMDLSIIVSTDQEPETITEDTLRGKSIEETIEIYQEYYFPIVEDLISYRNPQRDLSYRLSDTTWSEFRVNYLEAFENPKEQFFHEQFNQIQFQYWATDYSEGDPMDFQGVSIPYYHFIPFEVLDEIPLKTLEEIVEEHKGREIFGQKLKLEHIVRAEVFYYTFPTAPYFPPVYKLYIKMENAPENFDIDLEDQMMIVPIEVLAVPEKYDREQ